MSPAAGSAARRLVDIGASADLPNRRDNADDPEDDVHHQQSSDDSWQQRCNVHCQSVQNSRYSYTPGSPSSLDGRERGESASSAENGDRESGIGRSESWSRRPEGHCRCDDGDRLRQQAADTGADSVLPSSASSSAPSAAASEGNAEK